MVHGTASDSRAHAVETRTPVSSGDQLLFPLKAVTPEGVLLLARSPSKLKRTPPQAKIRVTSKSPVGDISVVTLIRTDTTLDHSQKAEKVCYNFAELLHATP